MNSSINRITDKELALKPANEIRNNSNLMRLYIERYKAVFNSEPNCAGCTFSSDFTRFKNAILTKTNLKTGVMANKNQVRQQYRNEILTYKKGNKTFRSYGRLADDEFIDNYLKNGTKEEIAERKNRIEKPADAAKGNRSNKGEKGGNPQVNALAELTLAELEPAVQEIESIGQLKQLIKRERAEDDRVGAEEIINKRIQELKDTEEDPEITKTPETGEEVGS